MPKTVTVLRGQELDERCKNFLDNKNVPAYIKRLCEQWQYLRQIDTDNSLGEYSDHNSTIRDLYAHLSVGFSNVLRQAIEKHAEKLDEMFDEYDRVKAIMLMSK